MRRSASSLLIAVSLAACQLGGARSFDVRLPSPGEEIAPLDVVVVDHAGVVVDVRRDETSDWTEGVGRGDRPAQVIVSWLGGLCDTLATLSITSDAGALTIHESTETTGSGCLLAGIHRSVALDLRRDIPPENIELVSEGGH